MDPPSAAASVVACYQMASAVGGLCFRYVKGVQQANRDSDLLLAHIEIFNKSLLNLQRMLTDETFDVQIHKKIGNAHSGGKIKSAMYQLSWPLKLDEFRQSIAVLDSFASAVDRALNIDTRQ